ncbi:bifunctional glycosyltransferase family 2 protein/CDP-glycerol:glycerophosphate glycerophosphotransferase [Streptomyces sp. Je 1-332]|uniref:bifunctional glycosyltransferase/CDP-glycerol:glycerophosphate glycerophosphotransferase n=1 Tax=Streptomyces sp. Je 1-332 TaxID=3231270 RepID=UPI00345A0C12
MPVLSVVVPFQNVEAYLGECLRSLALQSFADFEAILVDDGSTDGSTELAERFCALDTRFRLIRQESHGPGHARNTGIRAASTDAEFLGFLDGDDVVTETGYELMIRTLRRTGSDFISGNVRMMDSRRIWQSPLHREFMNRDQRRTHITRTPELLYDRTVWNKVFRRSFWDAHDIAFPEDILYEDIWVNLYAHFSAAAVDVVRDHVYFWRRRDAGAGPSITQRQSELGNLKDRFTAVESISRFLGSHNKLEYSLFKRRYDAACLKSDLMLHMNVLPDAEEEFRDHFLAAGQAFLAAAHADVLDDLPAVARVKWHLVAAGRKDELVALIERERGGGPLPVRRGLLRPRLDAPYADLRAVGVPRKALRVGDELGLRSSLTSARWEDGVLRLSGRSYVHHLDAARRRDTVKGLVVRHRKQRRMLAIPARSTYTPEATEYSRQKRYSYDWAGFEASFDPRRLQHRGRWVEGTWDVAAGSLTRGVLRYGRVIAGDNCSASHPPSQYVAPNIRIVPLFVDGSLKIRVEKVRCRITGHRMRGDELELDGVLLADEVPPTGILRLRRLTGAGQHDAPVVFRPGGDGWCRFTVRFPVALLASAASAHPETVPRAWRDGGNGWKTTLHIPGRKRPFYPVVPPETADGMYVVASGGAERGHREVVVHRNGAGYLVLWERAELPVADRCSWSADGTLVLAGDYPGYANLTPRQRDALRLVLRSRAKREEHAVPVTCVGGRFRATFDPARMSGPAGTLPLHSGRWDLALSIVQPHGDPQRVTVKLHRDLLAGLPATYVDAEGRRYEAQTQGYDKLTLMVFSAMPVTARGPYRQKRLQARYFPQEQKRPLRDAVLFDSFRGTQFSDSPRAVYEELVRRGTDLELLWTVRDDQVQIPAPGRAVRMWSPEWYEAMARSRFLVHNNHIPGWFTRREGQTVVQTWHGTPLKRIGHDMPAVHFADRDYLERIGREARQWSMLVSPNEFSTPILRRAFDFHGEILQTGYPRNDVLYSADRDDRARAVRARLGLPDGKKTVLYAPTWRDDQYHGAGRYRFDFRIDVADARRRLGDDHVLLVRRHPNVVDPVPGAGDGFVFDVSAHPDMADLMLVTDVLVTDYSSLMFDFANTGRPMLFFTYDLEHYRDTLRGFYFDFAQEAPGPLLETSTALVDALCDLDRTERGHRLRYRAFRQRFCGLDDGGATARVVDRMFETGRQEKVRETLSVRLAHRLRRYAPDHYRRAA